MIRATGREKSAAGFGGGANGNFDNLGTHQFWHSDPGHLPAWVSVQPFPGE